MDRARLISGSINNQQRKLAAEGLVSYREKSRRTSSKGVTQMTAKQNNVDAGLMIGMSDGIKLIGPSR
jgi:hypothetical protein